MIALLASVAVASDVLVGPGTYEAAYASAKDETAIDVPAFRLDVLPVTESEFEHFVSLHPEWRRDRVPRPGPLAPILRRAR